jgi:predicted esterase
VLRAVESWGPEAVDRLEGLLDYLSAEHGMRRARVILMGFSNGTAMAFAAAMTPMSIPPVGIIAISGHVPVGDVAPLRGVPVYWGHGTRDSFIPVETAAADVKRLREAQVPVTFCKADVGHKLGADCLANLKSWFRVEFPTPSTQAADIAERDQ